jgi:hypothetical protein
MDRKLGIHGLQAMYDRAGKGLYHPRNVSEVDNMRQLLNWWMGGNQMAEIAHRNAGLPGLSTIRRRTTVPNLTASPSIPKAKEIESNIKSCFNADLVEVIVKQKVVHQVLMFDEIATEKRPRWDDKSNMILGICREHGRKTALELCNEKSLEALFNDVNKGAVHFASEVSSPKLELVLVYQPASLALHWSHSGYGRCNWHLRK